MGPLYPDDRLPTAREAARRAGVDALLMTPGADLRYLTGYNAHATERLTCLVLPAEGDPLLVVPVLERAMVDASPAGALDLDVVGWPETDDPYAVVAAHLRSALGRSPDRVAVGNRTWAEQALRLRGALPGAELTLAGSVLRELRMVKSPAEIEALRRAGQAIDRVHARMGEWLRVGRSEREVGRDIAAAILTEGHVSADFTIVGSGPNGASPHHELSDRVVQAGDVVVVDIGGTTAEGYCSDNTRTYVCGGRTPAEVADYYAVLLAAQRASTAAVRPGVTPHEVDAAARDVITAGGYGEFFIHRTGHGIGLEGHEEPYIVAGNTEPLQAGMAFSIEPGIYLPGRHGARIEDIVVCAATGADPLNVVGRDLVVLPG
ncbi:MAG: aminopeptidase P family protein [Geodermatophilaceae bacterium]|nr:aminopeptidase P family protein [Geodermatophilaceae bacterium]